MKGWVFLNNSTKRSKTEIFKRYLLFIISLFFAALGVALAKKAELGVSPISSSANVLSIKFDALSLGSWLIIWNCLLILGQIILLRKNFNLIELLQIPLSFLFGWFTDFWMWALTPLSPNYYIVRLLILILGTVILGLGVSLSVIADVIMNSGEAFVRAVADITGKKFGNIKIIFDIGCVVLAVLLSLIFFNFQIIGTREGTIIAALTTGLVVNFFCGFMSAPLNRILKGEK